MVGARQMAAVDQWQDNGVGSTNQFWCFAKNADVSYKIVNAYSGLDLEGYGFQTGNGAKVDQRTDNDGSNEHWNLVPIQ